ncbi:MAG: M23 family metallopeptidase [Desulfobacterales bacterium]|jgi:murein DD-endopeptidase MepM/ murein hydrolase activator NlpD|nr:M23 family metallopeptidase [Desulfobacteraceae bacterium]MBT7085454.1 M23 family metallopeptidase [Desulfobacterales bacterium]MBT7697700.1 M23 family metallopeptidase [Desulfobacterales bacterium]
MSGKITFFLANNTGSFIKQVTVHRLILLVLINLILVSLVFSGYIVFDYYKLKNSFYNSQLLKSKIASHNKKISGQRQQIQVFAEQINNLKSNLVDLSLFENKIRIIANIERENEQFNVFGVGGSIPHDLDSGFSLSEKHNTLLREMHEQLGQLNYASKNQKDGFEKLLIFLEGQRNLLSSTPAISPANGWITSRFGYRTSPFTGLREFHKGLDIAARKGTPVIASADGVVSFSGNKGTLGKTIVIDHGHGMVTRYAHLSKTLIKRGASIKRGDVIGNVGSSGLSTGFHLHYDVRLNGVSVNPGKYIIE